MIEDLTKYQIRKKDENGALIEAGFFFFENRFNLTVRRSFAFAIGFILLIIASIGTYWAGNVLNFGGLIGLCAIAMLTWAFRIRPKNLLQKRIVSFTADNKILVSEDTHWSVIEPPLRALPLGHDQIIGIQAEPAINLLGTQVMAGVGDLQLGVFAVNIYFEDEQRLSVGTNISSRDGARIAASQLTKALRAIQDPYWETR